MATFGKVWPKTWAVSLIVNRTRVLARHVSLGARFSVGASARRDGDITYEVCVYQLQQPMHFHSPKLTAGALLVFKLR